MAGVAQEDEPAGYAIESGKSVRPRRRYESDKKKGGLKIGPPVFAISILSR
jgi:hypothetical protein